MTNSTTISSEQVASRQQAAQTWKLAASTMPDNSHHKPKAFQQPSPCQANLLNLQEDLLLILKHNSGKNSL